MTGLSDKNRKQTGQAKISEACLILVHENKIKIKIRMIKTPKTM